MSKGAAFMVAQAALSRGATFASQLIVAWLIHPELMGVFSKALGVAAFFSFVQNLGVREILIKRFRRFERWSGPAFWLCLTGGLLACVVLISIAYPVSHWFGEPRCFPLIVVMALAMPFNAIANVPRARLGGELRFRETAQVELLFSVGTQVLTLIFAIAGAGAMSLAMPRVITAIIVAGWLYHIAPVRIRSRNVIRRARLLLYDSGLVTLTLLFTLVVANGDYVILGYMRGPEENGLYYFAFGLSVQAIVLVGMQARSLLFPAFNSLPSRNAQVAAFQRSLPLLTYCVAFTAFLQAGLSIPFFNLLIAPEYAGSARLMQILCVGMAFYPVGWAANSLIEAQGRFSDRLKLQIYTSLAFLPLAITGAYLGGAVGIALATPILVSLALFAQVFVACWPSFIDAQTSLLTLVRPYLLSATAVVPVAIFSELGESVGRITNVAILVLGGGATVGFLLLLVWIADRRSFNELWNRSRQILHRNR